MLRPSGSFMPSTKEPKPSRRPRKLPAGAAVSRHSEPIDGVEDLRLRTLTICEREFKDRFDEEFLPRGRSSLVGGWLIRMWEGEESRKRTEDEARALYERARQAAERGTLGRLLPEIEAYNRRTPHGSGGIATTTLMVIEHTVARGTLPLGAPGRLAPLGELAARHYKLGIGEWGRDDGFTALVWTIAKEAPRPPLKLELKNRDIAVMTVLCGAAPNWKLYEERDALLSPANVIRDVETRVRRLLGPNE
jgi:hypothetical protein